MRSENSPFSSMRFLSRNPFSVPQSNKKTLSYVDSQGIFHAPHTQEERLNREVDISTSDRRLTYGCSYLPTTWTSSCVCS